jgi:hypothetical protein
LVVCFIYLSFSKYRPETIFYAFYFLFFLINLIVLLKTLSSPKYLFYFLLSIVFLLKTLYVSFYYPLHKEEINHFRNGAFEIANIIGNKKELYLCQTTPHHLLYYLKYKYKLIPHIYYLKNCSNLPKNSFILFMEKNIPEEILKNYKIYPLKIRTKSYFLVSS